MSFFTSQRPSERFVRVDTMAMYYFIHQAERADTKQFRRCEIVEVGDFALCFRARILDPSLMSGSMMDEIFVTLRLSIEDVTLDVVGRCVWTEQEGEGEEATYLVGLEYTEAEDEDREAFMAKAAEVGELVDPSNAGA